LFGNSTELVVPICKGKGKKPHTTAQHRTTPHKERTRNAQGTHKDRTTRKNPGFDDRE
jgi:hypothetical protein